MLSRRELNALADVAEAAQAWLEYHDRGKIPAGSLPALERYYAEAETHPERVREALSRVG